jgi:hypothetical protein
MVGHHHNSLVIISTVLGKTADLEALPLELSPHHTDGLYHSIVTGGGT